MLFRFVYTMNVQHNVIISPKVMEKLNEKHDVKKLEIEECFLNYDFVRYLKDTREIHQTIPPTLWCISETHRGRLLKIAFILKEGDFHIKSAFEPNQQEIDLFYSTIQEKFNG
jgi:hypothetical protein